MLEDFSNRLRCLPVESHSDSSYVNPVLQFGHLIDSSECFSRVVCKIDEASELCFANDTSIRVEEDFAVGILNVKLAMMSLGDQDLSWRFDGFSRPARVGCCLGVNLEESLFLSLASHVCSGKFDNESYESDSVRLQSYGQGPIGRDKLRKASCSREG